MRNMVRALVVTTALAAAPAAHANTWYTFGGDEFALTPTAGDWNTEEAQAVSDGGFLATIPDQATENFIISTFLTPQPTPLPLWIGFYDPTQDSLGGSHASNFVWASGAPVTYTDWNTATGEPNNTSGIEYYTAINWHTAVGEAGVVGTWNDVPLDGTTGYGGSTTGPYFGIEEVAVPEPGTLGLLGLGLAALGLVRTRQRRETVGI